MGGDRRVLWTRGRAAGAPRVGGSYALARSSEILPLSFLSCTMWEETALLQGEIYSLQKGSLARFRVSLYF